MKNREIVRRMLEGRKNMPISPLCYKLYKVAELLHQVLLTHRIIQFLLGTPTLLSLATNHRHRPPTTEI